MEALYIEKRFMVVIEKLSGCSLHDVTPEEEKLPTITTHYTPILPMYPIDTCNGPISDLNHLLHYCLIAYIRLDLVRLCPDRLKAIVFKVDLIHYCF